jgi:hypothetical protein
MTIAPGTIVALRESPAEGLFIVNNRVDTFFVTVRPFAEDRPGEGALYHVSSLTPIPALSIWQPWAWLIVRGFKDVENRTWAPKQKPPWLLIHASKRFRPGEIVETIKDIRAARLIPEDERVTLNDIKAQTGGIVGIARLTSCLAPSYDCRSPWADPDSWHWLLKDARPLPFHPCKGQQGLFYPTYDLGLLQEIPHA